MERARSIRTGDTSVPNADSTLALGGKMIVSLSRRSATPQACTGPAPPKARMVTPRRSTPLLDTVHPGRGGHVLVDHFGDPGRGVHHRQAESGRSGSHRGGGRIAVEGHVAPQEGIRVEQAQHHVGVGHRGRRAAAAVGRRTRIGPRGLRAHLQQSEPVEPGQRAPRPPRSRPDPPTAPTPGTRTPS